MKDQNYNGSQTCIPEIWFALSRLVLKAPSWLIYIHKHGLHPRLNNERLR